MKKLLLILFAFGMAGCTKEPEKQKSGNTQQEKFNNYFSETCSTYNALENDIKKSEFYNQFEKDAVKFTDSLGVFNNWKGNLKSLTSDETTVNIKGIDKIVTQIEIEVETEGGVTFKSFRFFEKKDIDSNLIYRQLKNMVVGSPVYFDGFIRKDENKIQFQDNYSSDNGYNICNPSIEFRFISISNDKLNFNSENFKKVTNIQKEIWRNMQDFTNKKISRKQLNKRLVEQKNPLEKLVKTLNKGEKAYVKSYTDNLASQFME